jgi:hypothetical protein
MLRIDSPIRLAAAAMLIGALVGCGGATTGLGLTNSGQTSPFSQYSAKFPATAYPRANDPIGHVVYNIGRSWVRPDKRAKASCIYLSLAFSGVIDIYSAKKPYVQTGQLTSSNGYGWGVAAYRKKVVYAATNANTIDFYTPCTGATPTGSVTTSGNGSPYGVSVAPDGSLYATQWSSNTIDYWTAPVTSGEAVTTATDPNMSAAAFINVDSKNAYIVGWSYGGREIVDACSTTITGCTTIITMDTIYGGFPGGVVSDDKGNLYVNNNYGALYSYSGCPSACSLTGSFVYNNGINAIGYTGIALDHKAKNIWGANDYLCASCRIGIAGDAQRQSLPLSSAKFNGHTPGVNNDYGAGIAIVPAYP